MFKGRLPERPHGQRPHRYNGLDIGPNLRPLIVCEVGSRIYGCQTGADDTDLMCVAVPPKTDVLGLGGFESAMLRTAREGERSGPDDTDLVVYSVRKWMRLALVGNPTVLVPLFVPDSRIWHLDEWFAELRDSASTWLIHKQMGKRYLGYMQGQWTKLTGERAGKRNKRPELVAAHGYDTKYAYHTLRLGIQGVELMRTGQVTIPFQGNVAELLLAVRRGERTLAEMEKLVTIWVSNLEDAMEASPLPEGPNRAAANDWLISAHTRTWRL